MATRNAKKKGTKSTKEKRSSKSTKPSKKEKASGATASQSALARRTQNTAFLIPSNVRFRTGLGESPAARWPFPTHPTLH
jgi:hypothetical protein